MRRLIIAGAVVAAVMALAGVAHAEPWYPPYETNADCLDCHDVQSEYGYSPVDFRAGRVNYRACETCHRAVWDTVGHHYHFMPGCGPANGDDCHELSKPDSELKLPKVSTRFGWFNNAQSLATSPEKLHQIHVNTSWVVDEPDFRHYPCRRCHGAVACSACHTQTPAHGQHASSEFPPVTYVQSNGRTAVSAPSTCVNPSCHALATAGTEMFTPNCVSCHEDERDFHGYDPADHATVDSMIELVACSACHSLDLATEHDKPTSSSAGEQCRTCHLGTVDAARPWDGGCVTGDCHTENSAAPFHAGADAAHEAPADKCYECHGGRDLSSVHSSAQSGDGRISCLVCHVTE